MIRLAVVLSLAGASLWFLFAGDEGPEVTSSAGAETRVALTSTILTTSNRSALEVCVDGAVDLVTSADDVERVIAILRGALTDIADRFPSSVGYRDDAAASLGCPPPTAALSADDISRLPNTSRHGDLLGEPVRFESDQIPSDFRVLLYFVPDSDYAIAFGNKPYAEGPAEMMCVGHECAEVTTAIYAASSTTDDVLGNALLDAIGIDPEPSDPVLNDAERNRQLREALEEAGLAPDIIDQFFRGACEILAAACEASH